MTALEKQQKKISVIIPVYNAEKYIRETLDSIIKQSYKNLEIILIDNGSKDRSPDIIQKYEAKYPEIHMIEESGKGPGASRNRAPYRTNSAFWRDGIIEKTRFCSPHLRFV